MNMRRNLCHTASLTLAVVWTVTGAALAGGESRARDDQARIGKGPAKIETIGKLVIIGGHEDKRGSEVVLREFVRLAGGERAGSWS